MKELLFVIAVIVASVIILLAFNLTLKDTDNIEADKTKREMIGDGHNLSQKMEIEELVDTVKEEEDSSQIPDEFKTGKISEENWRVIIDIIKNMSDKPDKSINIYIKTYLDDPSKFEANMSKNFNAMKLDYVKWVVLNSINVLSFYTKTDPNNSLYKQYVKFIITEGNKFLINVDPLTAAKHFDLFESYLKLLSMYQCLFEGNSENRSKENSICHEAIVALVPQWNSFFKIDIKGFDVVKINVPRLLTDYLYDYFKFTQDRRRYDKVIGGVFDNYKSSSEEYDSYDYFFSIYKALTV